VSAITNNRKDYSSEDNVKKKHSRIQSGESEAIPIVQPTRCTCYLKLFILVKPSICFGLSFRPSSGAQNCVYSNVIRQTAAATCCYSST